MNEILSDEIMHIIERLQESGVTAQMLFNLKYKIELALTISILRDAAIIGVCVVFLVLVVNGLIKKGGK